MMGELLHVGGLASSLELAEGAGIAKASTGVELCCGNGASMRMLVQLVEVASMTGIELSGKQVERTTTRIEKAGLTDRIEVLQRDACDSGLADSSADFIWSEDAWCYVPDKARLVAEAVRIAKPGGVIAFTHWTLGQTPLSDAERERFFGILKFPGLWDAASYGRALQENGCEIVELLDTERFAPCFELYRQIFSLQLGWDVLEIMGANHALLDLMVEQLSFIVDLSRAQKVVQSRIIARRSS